MSFHDKKDYDQICYQLRLYFGTAKMPIDISYPFLADHKMDKTMTVLRYNEKFITLAEGLDVNPSIMQAFFTNGLIDRIKAYVNIR